jgi:hypothetical protein
MLSDSLTFLLTFALFVTFVVNLLISRDHQPSPVDISVAGD